MRTHPLPRRPSPPQAGQGAGGEREEADGSHGGAEGGAAAVAGGAGRAEAGDGESEEGGAGGRAAGLTGRDRRRGEAEGRGHGSHRGLAERGKDIH